MTDNKEISPQDQIRHSTILDVVSSFQDAGKPVPRDFICGQRDYSDGRPVIQVFQMNVKEVTANGGIKAEWSPPSTPPTPEARKTIQGEIQRQERNGEIYPAHCVPIRTPGSP